ncbi:ABC transporter permease subunit [Mesorhizobium sp.]|uniref:ABC transporter permease subunit n=1 Tax=Mesorhizobium sp. TaxID=1871066 RepID=UPI000FE2EB8E|nr:ABC transporter permease subunit [Mesorhizobium sp.]RWH69332.1 MAG: hypothetical protein EOQ84_22145 [Mesorhizobium sp.]RWL27819.1 MAG: hypothetical protein EOR58_14220 [Mesorhizobium sp.]RWL29128.1 MAG: hypothetical protein EOR63_19335 [Mesorhizobium sp.]RWL37280.1 MAG: hypothetical protein EOR59_19045 [Mesorhizobium sp.]RWL55615.1 MAG: hypothetical protein EOR61_11990 [Mesorhizobium sp.]
MKFIPRGYEFERAGPVSNKVQPVVADVAGRLLLCVLTLLLNTGAYCGEIWRGAIKSIPDGQCEAGQSLDLWKTPIMTSVLLPQASRLALPTIGGPKILLMKGTALASTVTVFELIGAAHLVRAQTH